MQSLLIISGTMLILFCVAAEAAEIAEPDEKFRAITGLSLQEVKACQADSDCVLVSGFSGCCTQESINKSHQDAVEHKRQAIWDALTSSAMKKNCALQECAPPMEKPACRKNQCVGEAFAAKLMSKQAKEIADKVLLKNGLNPEDFSVPAPSYVARQRIWMVDYGSKLSTHAQHMQDSGRDDAYSVLVIDTTGEGRLNKYFVMKP